MSHFVKTVHYHHYRIIVPLDHWETKYKVHINVNLMRASYGEGWIESVVHYSRLSLEMDHAYKSKTFEHLLSCVANKIYFSKE